MMNYKSPFRDTIFALSSGNLPSGVAVIRLSGPHVRKAIKSLAGNLPIPRRAELREFRDADGILLDRSLLIFFPAPASFTGEDAAEFQVHGGRAVVSAFLDYLSQLEGLRSAEAGEFSRRAFINGKIDLTGAEGLSDLIAAETEAQRRLALINAEGGQKALYDAWRKQLLYARALIEAELDFSDESDVEGINVDAVKSSLQHLANQIQEHVREYKAAEIIRDGFRVVLIGAPNAGKSSLLNALAKREVAIVTNIPGTTRDLIEVGLDLNGSKVIVTDTAGLRQTNEEVEKIGVEKAISAAINSDLIIHLTERNSTNNKLTVDFSTKPFLSVITKVDLPGDAVTRPLLGISTITGEGIDDLISKISSQAKSASSTSANIIPTRLRHVELLRSTADCIINATKEDLPELLAEQLRQASDSLGKITGAVDVEELLGVIFSQFCIGK